MLTTVAQLAAATAVLVGGGELLKRHARQKTAAMHALKIRTLVRVDGTIAVNGRLVTGAEAKAAQHCLDLVKSRHGINGRTATRITLAPGLAMCDDQAIHLVVPVYNSLGQTAKADLVLLRSRIRGESPESLLGDLQAQLSRLTLRSTIAEDQLLRALACACLYQ